MLWIGANTDYKIDFPVPQVERMGIIMEEIILPSHKLFFVSWYSYLYDRVYNIRTDTWNYICSTIDYFYNW